MTDHWLVGYYFCTQSSRQALACEWRGLITMGECWYNNHHAFPGSAKLGLYKGELDPGWWVLSALKKVGLVWDIKLPYGLPERPELQP